MESRLEELSKYRFECSIEALEDAKIMFKNGRYKNTLNRAYYSVFHALRAVNVLDGFDSSKHSGVIAHFNKNYVKTEIFENNHIYIRCKAILLHNKGGTPIRSAA